MAELAKIDDIGDKISSLEDLETNLLDTRT
jgi:hypothetical protein